MIAALELGAMRTVLVRLCVALLGISKAEGWTRQVGSAESDFGQRVAVSTSGNVYVAGHTFGDLNGESFTGFLNVFLMKFDANGVFDWVTHLPAASNARATGVGVSSDEEIYVAGWTSGGEFDGIITQAGSPCGFLSKFNSSGVKEWSQLVGTTGNDYAQGVFVDSDGAVHVVGETNQGFSGHPAPASVDAFAMKLNSSGGVEWIGQQGFTDVLVAQGGAMSSAGDVYITGRTVGSVSGRWVAFLMKFNASGELQWSIEQAPPAEHVASLDMDVAVSSSEDVYVTGTYFTSLIGEENQDLFLMMFNSSGAWQWTAQAGTSRDDTATSVAVSTMGDVYVTGYTQGTFDGEPSFGVQDAFLMKFSSDGVLQWTRTRGASVLASYDGVTVGNDGDVYAVGSVSGIVDGQNSSGGSDILVMQFEASSLIRTSSPTSSSSPTSATTPSSSSTSMSSVSTSSSSSTSASSLSTSSTSASSLSSSSTGTSTSTSVTSSSSTTESSASATSVSTISTQTTSSSSSSNTEASESSSSSSSDELPLVLGVLAAAVVCSCGCVAVAILAKRRSDTSDASASA